MNMREIINLVETVVMLEGISTANKKGIVNHMVETTLNGTYWDLHATNTYPEREFSSHDGLSDMLDTWRDDLPESIQSLDDDEILETPEFRQLMTQWANARYDEVIKKLSAVPLVNGKYRIHRVMRVNDPEAFCGGGKLGIYWTYDLEGWNNEIGAYPIWAGDKGGADIMIEAFSPPASIDWEFTILANMDWFSGDREYELRLLQDSAVEVDNIFVDQDYDLPIDDGAKFIA